jgi:hypothetical protein
MIMLRKAFTALALVPLVWGAEEFEVLLEDMIEKVCPLCDCTFDLLLISRLFR